MRHPFIDILLVVLSLCLGGCSPPDPKVEAERSAAIKKVTRFFDSIPSGDPKDGHVKCYRKGTTSEIVLELGIPTKMSGKKVTRESMIELLGTYFVVQEIRDLAKHQVHLTCIEKNLDGKELSRVTVYFSEIIPFYNGHDF